MSKGVNKVLALYLNGRSIPQVSDCVCLSMSAVRYHLKKAGVLRTREEAIRLSAKQGRLGSGNRGKKLTFTQEWKDNISKGRSGKGVGLSKKPNGYVEITMGENKGRGQHCIVAENNLGRKIKRNECVHHKDGVRANNDPDNLEVMTRSEHARLHALENKPNRKRDSFGRYI